MIIGKVGDRAFLDGIEGLVPCTVLAITEHRVKVKMQAKDGVVSWHGMSRYGDWDTEEEFNHRSIVPAAAVRINEHWRPCSMTNTTKIKPYKWEQ